MRDTIDKLTFADAMDTVLNLPDPVAGAKDVWFGSDAPPAALSPPPSAPSPPPPNTVGSTSSDADDD